jgi:hypothetical protein
MRWAHNSLLTSVALHFVAEVPYQRGPYKRALQQLGQLYEVSAAE